MITNFHTDHVAGSLSKRADIEAAFCRVAARALSTVVSVVVKMDM
jgi:hypothetical protein